MLNLFRNITLKPILNSKLFAHTNICILIMFLKFICSKGRKLYRLFCYYHIMKDSSPNNLGLKRKIFYYDT